MPCKSIEAPSFEQVLLQCLHHALCKIPNLWWLVLKDSCGQQSCDLVFSCPSCQHQMSLSTFLRTRHQKIELLPIFACHYFLKTLERSEEHTSELQSRPHLVCRLLLEKKKKK